MKLELIGNTQLRYNPESTWPIRDVEIRHIGGLKPTPPLHGLRILYNYWRNHSPKGGPR